MPEAGKLIARQRGKGSPAPRAVALGRLMRSQDGVAGVNQLQAIGYAHGEIRGMVSSGQLWRVRRAVYADARSPMTPRGHLFAAVLSFPPDAQAFFSHRTAAALLGLRALLVSRLELTIVAEHTPRRPPLWVHRVGQAPPAEEIVMRNGLRVSSAHRMLAELAPRVTRDDACTVHIEDLVLDRAHQAALAWTT